MNTNHVRLIGFVGKDLVSRKNENGRQRVAIRMATHQLLKNQNDEKAWHTVWHDVVAWNNTAEFAERNFVKGSRIMVEGAITYRIYPDNQGHLRYQTLITAHNLVNLDR